MHGGVMVDDVKLAILTGMAAATIAIWYELLITRD